MGGRNNSLKRSCMWTVIIYTGTNTVEQLVMVMVMVMVMVTCDMWGGVGGGWGG